MACTNVTWVDLIVVEICTPQAVRSVPDQTVFSDLRGIELDLYFHKTERLFQQRQLIRGLH